MTGTVNLHTVVSQPYAENTYLLWRPERSECLAVDPGLEPDLILDFLGEQGLSVAAILNTHGHADHIGGNAALKSAFPGAPLIIGINETHLLTDPWANLSAVFGTPFTSPPADQTVRDGELLEVGGFRFEVREIPGHSPGHVVFVHLDEPRMVLGGDVLFREGVGRTDFPGGSFEVLRKGIHEKLFTLPTQTPVYPGHGPVTTVGHEMRFNPFVAVQR